MNWVPKWSALVCEPSGLNINDAVGATAPKALSKAVLANRADLGIALDGDADRLRWSTPKARSTTVTSCCSPLSAAARSAPVKGVVGTLMSNLALEHALGKLDIPFARAAVGDRYVVEMLNEKGWLFGGENSGHILCLDKHTTGDGIVFCEGAIGS
jgi:phosphoglucosamine mutase